eukprot:3968806-Pleurochrysis_carterae.AAC.1
MNNAEEYVKYVVNYALENCAEDLAFFTKFYDKTLQADALKGMRTAVLSYLTRRSNYFANDCQTMTTSLRRARLYFAPSRLFRSSSKGTRTCTHQLAGAAVRCARSQRSVRVQARA